MQRLWPFLTPLLVIGIVIAGIVGIGELLLAVGTGPAVPVALGLALGAGFVAMLLSLRAAKLPPVELPAPVEPIPVRRLDLGAGYIVGQFIAIFVVMLVLLFIVLALKQH